MGSMSQSVASSMKMLIVLALAALAAAKPEADPYYYGYGGVGYGHLGYGLGYYGYGKRSADAEPFYPYAVGGFASVSPSASVATWLRPCCHPCRRRTLCWSWQVCGQLCWSRPCRQEEC